MRRERWIDDGRVTVNGKKASVGDKADPRRDKIFVDGKPIGGAEEKVYLMLYKAARLCHDDDGTSAAARRLPIWYAAAVRVSCRSAVSTEGLLLLTNDGDLVNARPIRATRWKSNYACAAILTTFPLAEPMEIDRLQHPSGNGCYH